MSLHIEARRYKTVGKRVVPESAAEDAYLFSLATQSGPDALTVGSGGAGSEWLVSIPCSTSAEAKVLAKMLNYAFKLKL